MSFLVNVKQGTNAGWRTIRERPRWTHTCRDSPHGLTVRMVLSGSYYSCPSCGARRP